MSYSDKLEMYPEVITWLSRILNEQSPGAEINVRDTHASSLRAYIRQNSLQQYFRSLIWQRYEIRVDITGFILYNDNPEIVFVECKTTPITLINVSQLLGYSRVALPSFSYLISTKGIGSAVVSLINTYGRTDILEYEWPKGKSAKTIVLGTWDIPTKRLDPATVLPPGIFTHRARQKKLLS